MGSGRLPMLRVGECVRFDGDEHQVVALAGTSVRLRSRGGAAQVVLLAFLLAAADFELLDDHAPALAVEPFGLLETLPGEVVDRTRWWERHVVEVVTGRVPDAPQGSAPRPGFDPASTKLQDRDAVKAAELTAAGHRPRRARSRGCGCATRSRVCGGWSISGSPAAAIWSAGPMSGWWPRSGLSWRRRRTSRRALATG